MKAITICVPPPSYVLAKIYMYIRLGFEGAGNGIKCVLWDCFDAIGPQI